MCVLGREEIRKRIRKGMIRDYIDLELQLQSNGFDCTLKEVTRFKSFGIIDFDNKKRSLAEVETIEFEDFIHLQPGVYRVKFNEILKLENDVMAIARPRSSLIRCGADVLTAVWDAGYEGRSEAALVVHNPYGIKLSKNARIVQLVFIKLCSITKPYSGIYKYENL